MKKKLFYFFVIIGIIFALISYKLYKYYQKNYINNIAYDTYLFIPTGASFKDVKQRIKSKVIDYSHFVEIAEKENYPKNIKAGKYKLNVGENNQEIIAKLISGNQEKVHLKITSYDHISQIAEKLRQNIEADSVTIYNALQEQKIQDKLTDIDEVKLYFIPGEYTILWNWNPKKIINQAKGRYSKFWNQERINKAKELNLTPNQITILASITQRESNRVDEQSRIAGLYINRLKKGMKLQSDPTVLFAKRKKEGFDKKYYRVYYSDLSIDSPYNTYRNLGLPPIAICSPKSEVIDAVLNAEKHNYIFMCASPKRIGYHDFTDNYREHENNAEKYRRYLDSINVK
ncbi:MAG: endolytic transglycosylase MltG [Flavobacteriales bacterium]|nr:endolytic transglycosylase MltG [Flavobacteriales bacterium]